MADSKDPGPPLPASRSKGKETSSSDSATGNKITISIRTLDGKTTKIVADRSWSIQQLKAAFGEYRGQDFSRVNMHYKGKRLKDDLKIEAYNIDSG